MSTPENNGKKPEKNGEDGGPTPARIKGAPQRGGPGGPMAGAMPTEKAMHFKESSLRLLRMMRPERATASLALLLGVVSVTLSVVGPKILGHATNLIFGGVIGKLSPAGLTRDEAIATARATGNDTIADVMTTVDFTPGQGIDFGEVGRVLLIVLALFVLSSAAMLWQGRLTTTIVQRTAYRLREQAETKLARLPLGYFDKQPRGEILSRTTNDIDNISQTLQQALSQLVISLLTIVGVLLMMILISPLLALIAVITVPVSLWVTVIIGKRAQPQFLKQWGTTGKLNGHIEEMFTGHALVKVFGRQKEASATFAEHNEDLFQAAFKAQFISGIIQPAMMFIGNVNYVLVAVIGGLRVASGTMSLGDVQAFIQYSRQFSQPITQVASMANLLQSGVASAERVFDLLDSEEQSPEPAEPLTPADTVGRVAFEHVSFRYEEDKPLIDDLSLSVEPGHTVAIVGPTGAGKTTLVNLLMRFYEVRGGRITLDGVDIAAMTREDLRARTGMVLQDTWLFGGTIAQNIVYGVGEVSEERMLEAARATHVDHFVRTLPDGYDTIIDEEGSNLSAGEKQLITIARAFLTEPTILVLDEATSSVDTRTEVLIQRAMTELRSGRTSFVIAHRLSTIRDADLILVMENGSIVEQGDHEGLLEAGGAYARLYAAQFAEAVVGVD
ncbi:ATP-binding cassette subfamily B protein [Phytomonospora endophytica]|uniref:Fatty acid ABC transporter ATP-binding/permease protein n=2 Tax=Phytomonospora endophytica TaxID=714109 RepID=A0A841FKD5_9ACTN|nr:ATP-binding cassette subfamily B protein [Phytomonospora endophytica]GIG67241.1 multidrug ABC transporter ATP-binding protein [Phytomonospora endophytica]